MRNKLSLRLFCAVLTAGICAAPFPMMLQAEEAGTIQEEMQAGGPEGQEESIDEISGKDAVPEAPADTQPDALMDAADADPDEDRLEDERTGQEDGDESAADQEDAEETAGREDEDISEGGAEETGAQVTVIQGGEKTVSGWSTVNRKKVYVDPATGKIVKDEWRTIGGRTYRFDKNGDYVTGWYEEDGSVYFFDSNGALKTGYVYVAPGKRMYFYPQTDKRFGTYATGWQVIGGKTCWFGTDGVISSGVEKIGGKTYLLNADGSVTTGWDASHGTEKYYYEKTAGGKHIGQMAEGFANIDGKPYYFTDSGAMKKGFFEVNGFLYYGGQDGVLRRGWQTVSGKKYYFWPDTGNGHYRGTAAKGWKNIDGKNYYFYPSGTMATGWVKANGFTYYYKEDGTQTRGWASIGKKTYYFWPKTEGKHYSGTMATGFQKVNGFTYYFGDKGAQATGWTTVSKSVKIGSIYPYEAAFKDASTSREYRYYFWPDTRNGHYKGTGAKGLAKIDGKTYFFTDGLMLRNETRTVNGTKYVFANNGTGKKAAVCRGRHSFDYGICTRCGAYVTPSLAVKEIRKMNSRYPAGTAWGDNSTYRAYIEGYRETNYACEGFALLLSDAAFKNLPVQYHKDMGKIRPGDMIGYRTGIGTIHAVIVLEVHDSYYVIAEGNNNGRVVWNRKLSKAEVRRTLVNVKTRYIR